MKLALRVAGGIFLFVALTHLVRVICRVPIIIGHHPIRYRASVLGFVISVLLSFWMFKASSCGDKKGCCGS